MSGNTISRRGFVKKTSIAAAAGAAAGAGLLSSAPTMFAADGQLALLGGTPVKKDRFPSWPVVEANDEKQWMEVLHKKRWCRLNGDYVKQFEAAWAKELGVKWCVATNGGTTALTAALNGLQIGPGDEILTTPNTFVATINVILTQYALPIFVDTDPETQLINADLLEQHITDRTRAILPVHLGGSPANLDKIMAVAKKHNLVVIEDSCQAVSTEWRGKRTGGIGDLGCFSLQASKNLNSGEGGVVSGNDENLQDVCYAASDNGRSRTRKDPWPYNGSNSRMTEFQGALLLTQLARFEEQSRLREKNAAYLNSLLEDIPGCNAAKTYEGCTRHGYHLYMMRYQQDYFSGVPRAKFLEAMNAEGIPCSGGYSSTLLYQMGVVRDTLNNKFYKRIYSEARLKKYWEETDCPVTINLLANETIWLGQSMLLGTRKDMEQIAEAIKKIQANANQLAKS